MFFSTGMGIGLMFFGVAEPVMHFLQPPTGEAGTVEAARIALSITFFHWGFHGWAVYVMVALILAFDIIEGPPRRQCPILLRQTSFKALEEAVNFTGEEGSTVAGTHTARFGEIEQRGVALTPKGRVLYDQLLNAARSQLGATPNATNADEYYQLLSQAFEAFPDDYHIMHEQGLAYFYYQVNEAMIDKASSHQAMDELISNGVLRIEPIVYEDFLPVSAAGIFHSNLKDAQQGGYRESSNQDDFEKALGAPVHDELELYRMMQERSKEYCIEYLKKQASK